MSIAENLQEHVRRRMTGEVLVVSNEQIAENTWKIRLKAHRFISLIAPGQFVMLRLPNRQDPLLGRPFAVYSVSPQSGFADVIYLTVGRMTNRLCEVRANDILEMTGPLGRGWEAIDEQETFDPQTVAYNESALMTEHLIMIAGGIGQTALYMLAGEFLKNGPIRPKRSVSLLYGARTESRLCCINDFDELGVNIHLATEDGSRGYKGFATDMLAEVFEMSQIPAERTKIVCCGPQPMLRAAARKAKELDLRCWVSLESRMACGLGICFGCVVDYLDDNGNWDYRRTCIDGPVFDAARLKWD